MITKAVKGCQKDLVESKHNARQWCRGWRCVYISIGSPCMYGHAVAIQEREEKEARHGTPS